MLNQGTTIQSFRQRMGRGAKTWTMFVIGLVLVFLIALWTASHNVPMLMRGTVEMFRYFGAAAALSGEVLLMVCYILPFFTAGTQRTATILVGVWTFGILIFNSVIGYAQLAANDPMFSQIVDFYGGYIAPFPIFITVFFGVMIIVETSEEIRARNAEASAKVAERKRQTEMAMWAQHKTDEMLDSLPEVQQALEAGAVLAALEQAKHVFQAQTGREATDAEIQAALSMLAGRQPYVPQYAPPPSPVPGNNHKTKLPNLS